MQITTGSLCKNCQTPLTGVYCHQCGEKVLEEKDRSVLVLLENFVSGLWFLDGKVIRSFKLLFFKPGHYSSDFFEGIRKRYLSPMQIFLLANLIYFLFPTYNTFKTPLEIQKKHLPYSSYTLDYINTKQEVSALSEEDFTAAYNEQSTSFSKLLIILVAAMIGVVIRVLYIRKKNFYLTDIFNISLQFLAFFLLFISVVLPVVLFGLQWFSVLKISIQEFYFSVIILSISGLYLSFILKKLFQESIWLVTIKVLTIMVCIVPVFQIYRLILLFLTLQVI